MEKEREILAAALRQAMQAEWDRHNYYRMVAEKTSDPNGREAFNTLASEELLHFEFLKAQYKSIIESGAPDEGVILKGKRSLDDAGPIFSADFKKRLAGAHFEMSALSIAAQLELSAIHFYKGESEKSSIPVVKKFFQELANWESIHYRTLLNQQKSLQEDYWNENRFYPF